MNHTSPGSEPLAPPAQIRQAEGPSISLRWVIGLSLASIILATAAYFWPIPVLMLVAAIILLATAWARPFSP